VVRLVAFGVDFVSFEVGFGFHLRGVSRRMDWVYRVVVVVVVVVSSCNESVHSPPQSPITTGVASAAPFHLRSCVLGGGEGKERAC